jgi:hypothetical protein
MDDLKWIKLSSPERKRTYIFAQRNVVIENVASVCVRPSGNHRLETSDGKKYVIAAGWLAIELDVDTWTF